MIIYLDTDEEYSGHMIASGFAFDSTANFQVGNTVVYGKITNSRRFPFKTTEYKNCKKNGLNIIWDAGVGCRCRNVETYIDDRRLKSEWCDNEFVMQSSSFDLEGKLHGVSFRRTCIGLYYWYAVYEHGEPTVLWKWVQSGKKIKKCIGILPPDCTSTYREP